MTKKLSSLAVLVLAAFMLTATATSAAARTGSIINLKIDFEFQAGKEKLPAGEYSLRQLTASSFILKQAGKKQSVIINAPVWAGSTAKDEPARLVFHKYGAQYFLAEIYLQPSGPGRLLWKSEAERNAQTEVERLAKVKAKPEQVIVKGL